MKVVALVNVFLSWVRTAEWIRMHTLNVKELGVFIMKGIS